MTSPGSAPVTNLLLIRRREKKLRLQRWYRRHRGKCPILFEDETDLLLFPPLRSAWARRGRRSRVWLSGRNAKRVVFAAVNVKTGHHIELGRAKQKAVDFCAFLKLLHARYRGKRLILLLDRDRSHDAKLSQATAKKLRITLKWLPKRSPEMNALETLWGFAKPRVCANRQYEDIEDELSLFLKFLSRLSRYEALRVAGLKSKSFWLFNAPK